MNTRSQETSAKGESVGAECARQACTNPAEDLYHPALRWFYCKPCTLRINANAGFELIAPKGDRP